MVLKELTLANGISGDEGQVRDIIKKSISEMKIDSLFTDNIGNLYAVKNGGDKKIMLATHMDEVGLMVTSISDNGTLKFKAVGTIDDRVLASKKVIIGEKRISGVIGVKPVHLLEDEEKKSPLKIKSYYIDIGCSKKEQAEKLVNLGDYVYFDTEYIQTENNVVKTKALDDRVGCTVIIETLKDEYNLNIQACFTAQEEIGSRGSTVAANRLKPDMAIIVEGTVCSDIPGAEGPERVTIMNRGPAVSIIDKSSIANRKFFELVIRTAEKKGIKYQIKEGVYGSNDAGAIQRSCAGVATVVISVPCRYIHSPNSMASLNDIDETVKLVKAVLHELAED